MNTRELAFRAVGRLSNALNVFRPLMVRLRGEGRKSRGRFDKTGLVEGQRAVEILQFGEGVYLARYESLAHSLWRSQELTLVQRHKDLLQRPLVDFGCGDGSFAAAIFDAVDFGLDNDPEALDLCRRRQVYRKVALVSNGIPLPTGEAGGVLANSVLEHTNDLDGTLREISRVTRQGGILILTVPIAGFARHLARFFGRREERRVNREHHHRHLFEVEEWLGILENHGFEPFVKTQYQSAEFTFWYRILRIAGKRGLGASSRIQNWLWNMAKPKMVELVRSSVRGVSDGANVFIVARKK